MDHEKEIIDLQFENLYRMIDDMWMFVAIAVLFAWQGHLSTLAIILGVGLAVKFVVGSLMSLGR